MCDDDVKYKLPHLGKPVPEEIYHKAFDGRRSSLAQTFSPGAGAYFRNATWGNMPPPREQILAT